ncbi:hypothetical protein BHE74_00034361 [Ensete ventricosum]|nr:hypothetical protein BHE74_00034361 [Ensete ventricosum]RZS08352.1 hypothetical protein BHM03_00039311 [Ensete ventricosum]
MLSKNSWKKMSEKDSTKSKITGRQRGGGAASHSWPPRRAGHPRPGRSQGLLQGGGWLRGQGQPEREAISARKGQRLRAKASLVGAAAARGHDWLRPARRGGNRLQRDSRKGGWLQGICKGLSPVGATVPAAGVATPWQGSCCQRARAVAACARAIAATTA